MSNDIAIAAALDIWCRALVESVRREAPDLSARQMALLLSVYLTDPPHTVRGLAQALNISKPAVTRALDRLQGFGYVRRSTDRSDRRNVLIECTAKGTDLPRSLRGVRDRGEKSSTDSVSQAPDPNVNAYRPDVASARLRGVVTAERYEVGERRQARRGTVPLHEAPDGTARLGSELLFGEDFIVYDERDGWAWGQCALDDYVGYARSDALEPEPWEPTHKVGALRAMSSPSPTSNHGRWIRSAWDLRSRLPNDRAAMHG